MSDQLAENGVAQPMMKNRHDAVLLLFFSALDCNLPVFRVALDCNLPVSFVWGMAFQPSSTVELTHGLLSVLSIRLSTEVVCFK